MLYSQLLSVSSHTTHLTDFPVIQLHQAIHLRSTNRLEVKENMEHLESKAIPMSPALCLQWKMEWDFFIVFLSLFLLTSGMS